VGSSMFKRPSPSTDMRLWRAIKREGIAPHNVLTQITELYPILVVEDDPIIRDDIIDLLALSDLHALGASDGQQALNYMMCSPTCLVISDDAMPNMYGHELLEHMRCTPHLVDTPFIMVGANEEIMKALGRFPELKADDAIMKPFEAGEVLKSVVVTLNMHYFAGYGNVEELCRGLDIMV
jgi:DNA-binding response OmpR family regulator